jgi:hypothetical protein
MTLTEFISQQQERITGFQIHGTPKAKYEFITIMAQTSPFVAEETQIMPYQSAHHVLTGIPTEDWEPDTETGLKIRMLLGGRN